MKKRGILALSSAFALLTAGFGFAQDNASPASPSVKVGNGTLTLSGYVNAGVVYDFNSTKVKDRDAVDAKSVYGYARDADQPGYRAQLNLNYVADNWGVNTRFRAQPNKQGTSPNNANNLFVHYAYGWWQVSKFIKINGGIIDDGVWATKADLADDTGEGVGAQLHITPIAGLDFGGGIYLASPLVNGSGYVKDYPVANPANNSDDASANVFYSIGGAYTHEKFGAQGGLKLQNSNFSKAHIGANVNGVKDLTLAVEGFIYDSVYGYAQGNGAQKPAFWFDLKAGYKIDDLNLGLVFYYYSYDKDSGISGYAAWNNDYKAYKPDLLATISGQSAIIKYDFSVKPSVSYALAGGKIVPGLAAKIGVGLPDANGGGDKTSTLGIDVNPSIDFVIASSTRIQLGYDFYWRSLSYDGTTQVEKTDNAVYLDFLWKF